MGLLSFGNTLSLVIFIIYLNQGESVTRKDGYCVSYGLSPGGGGIPIAYNGPAKNSSDMEHFNLLKETCPYLSIDGYNSTTSCCDKEQLKFLKNMMATWSLIFGGCPACSRNLRDLWCEITCSPNQSTFLDYMAFIRGAFYMTSSFSKGLFDSCRDVRFPGTGNKALDLICGTMAEYCTPEAFLMGIGHPANGAPYVINFQINRTATDIQMNDHPMKRCNESFIDKGSSQNMSACYTDDCRNSNCQGPTRPPPPPRGQELIISINSTNTFPVDDYIPYQQSHKFSFYGLLQKSILDEIATLHKNIEKARVNVNGTSIELEDLCLKPNGTKCKIESILQYFQLSTDNLNKCITNMDQPCGPQAFGSRAEDWHDQIIGCTRFPYSKSNGNYLKMSCISTYGKAVVPKDVLKGYKRTRFNITAEAILIRLALKNISTPEDVQNVNAFKDGLRTVLDSWESSAGQTFNFTTSVVYNDPSAITTTTSPTTTVSPTTTDKTSNGVVMKNSFYGIILAYLVAMMFYSF